ncbi:hypothetical protein [Maricaulis salignorans]|uniref:hypothetical protein n=1 Tax=Maricaulis salignorans TaxID=144026 RepID=UPI000B839AD7|nr:hypothetical protein [Maricaulis salignorans]
MNRISFVLIGCVVTFLSGIFLLSFKNNDPYPVSLEQLQNYRRFHDFAGRSVLAAGVLTYDGGAFFLSDEIDGHHWVIEIDLEDADMRQCMLQMVGMNFVIVTGDFLANARLENIEQVTGGGIACFAN